MSFEQVKEFFLAAGAADRLLELPQSSATVELAAKAIGCRPERIAKTLSFLVGGRPVLIVAAGDARIDNRKFRSEFQEKAKMLPPEQVEALTGHAPGGVCPFAVKENTEIYLDISLKRFETVYPTAGSANSAVRLTIPELERYSCFQKWIDVCKEWETPLSQEEEKRREC